VEIEVFECPKCKKVFNQNTDPQTSSPQNSEPTIINLVEKLCLIKIGLKQNLANLKNNLGLLETERSEVLFELETLRKESESRADGLEEDVNRLREEIQDLREVLGLQKIAV
jgi:hypothetical protein